MGYTDESRAFMAWMEKRCREMEPGRPLQVMYRIDGTSELPEKVLGNFEGYRKSRPVRIGNAAGGQLQLDILPGVDGFGPYLRQARRADFL